MQTLLSRVNEKWVFFFLIFINSLPLLLFRFYPTMDGAAHLHNSNIIVRLLFDSNSIFHQFYEFNPQIVPNWLGHFFLALFNSFLPAYLAEKIVLISYGILLPFSFRYMVRQFNSNANSLTYLIFPFVFHFLFILGYYNFSFSFILFFYIAGLIHKNAENKFNLKMGSLFLFLFFLMSVAHIFGFVLTIVGLSLYFFWKIFLEIINPSGTGIKKCVVRYFTFLILSVPGIAIVLWHLIMHQSPDTMKTVGAPENFWDYIMKIRPIIAYNFGKEGGPTAIMFLILFSLFVLNFFLRIYSFKNSSPSINWKKLLILNDFWLILAIAMMLIMITFPNHIGGAGNVLNRFGLVFFLAIISWINLGILPKWIYKFFIFLFIVSNMVLIEYYVRTIKNLNKDAVEIFKASNIIEDNSTVYAYNTSSHWLKIHFSNYVVVEKSIFVNDNYEADMGYFPIKWKKNAKPNMELNTQIFDYFLVYGEKNEELPKNIIETLDNNYKRLYDDKNIKIFKRE